jgi:hypothetical protein
MVGGAHGSIVGQGDVACGMAPDAAVKWFRENHNLTHARTRTIVVSGLLGQMSMLTTASSRQRCWRPYALGISHAFNKFLCRNNIDVLFLLKQS